MWALKLAIFHWGGWLSLRGEREGDCEEFSEDNHWEPINMLRKYYFRKGKGIVFNCKNTVNTMIKQINQRQQTTKVSIGRNKNECIIHVSKSMRKLVYTRRVFLQNRFRF